MKGTGKNTLLIILCALFAFSLFAVNSALAYGDRAPAVKIAENKDVGRFLTDQKGMTLYYFTKDSPGMSVCSGMCLERWPIFHADVTAVPMGIDTADFGVITREDGRKQSTYKGRPLYYFFGDLKPGDLKGQDVGGVWYVVEP